MSFNVAFCINRIRLEFKVFYQKRYFETLNVLIESDWNLKILAFAFNVPAASVLIESDWNLKDTDIYLLANVECGINRIRLEFKGGDAKDIWLAVRVLIESDWNLKSDTVVFIFSHVGINRIRLEFKGKRVEEIPEEGRSINRIRLEFKANNHTIQGRFIFVLIESDWNLKNIASRPSWNFVKWY